jgi:hypothetical protein
MVLGAMVEHPVDLRTTRAEPELPLWRAERLETLAWDARAIAASISLTLWVCEVFPVVDGLAFPDPWSYGTRQRQ